MLDKEDLLSKSRQFESLGDNFLLQTVDRPTEGNALQDLQLWKSWWGTLKISSSFSCGDHESFRTGGGNRSSCMGNSG